MWGWKYITKPIARFEQSSFVQCIMFILFSEFCQHETKTETVILSREAFATWPQCGARKVRRIIESRRTKHQSQVIITPRAKEEMKRRLIFRTDGLAALNVIILTDCWQVVHYQRCTVDEVKPRTDRKCSRGWNMLRGVRSKEKKKN